MPPAPTLPTETHDDVDRVLASFGLKPIAYFNFRNTVRPPLATRPAAFTPPPEPVKPPPEPPVLLAEPPVAELPVADAPAAEPEVAIEEPAAVASSVEAPVVANAPPPETIPVEPDIAVEAEANQPDTSEPEPIETEWMEPGLVEPGLVEPGLVEPELIEPVVIEPDLIEPEPVTPKPLPDVAAEAERVEPLPELQRAGIPLGITAWRERTPAPTDPDLPPPLDDAPAFGLGLSAWSRPAPAEPAPAAPVPPPVPVSHAAQPDILAMEWGSPRTDIVTAATGAPPPPEPPRPPEPVRDAAAQPDDMIAFRLGRLVAPGTPMSRSPIAPSTPPSPSRPPLASEPAASPEQEERLARLGPLTLTLGAQPEAPPRASPPQTDDVGEPGGAGSMFRLLSGQPEPEEQAAALPVSRFSLGHHHPGPQPASGRPRPLDIRPEPAERAPPPPPAAPDAAAGADLFRRI